MHGNTSWTEKECKEFKLVDLISMGIIIRETDEYIVTGNDYCEEYNSYRNVVVYPKSGIKRIRRVKVRGKKNNANLSTSNNPL